MVDLQPLIPAKAQPISWNYAPTSGCDYSHNRNSISSRINPIGSRNYSSSSPNWNRSCRLTLSRNQWENTEFFHPHFTDQFVQPRHPIWMVKTISSQQNFVTEKNAKSTWKSAHCPSAIPQCCRRIAFVLPSLLSQSLACDVRSVYNFKKSETLEGK